MLEVTRLAVMASRMPRCSDPSMLTCRSAPLLMNVSTIDCAVSGCCCFATRLNRSTADQNLRDQRKH